MKVMIPKSKVQKHTVPEFVKSPIKLSISLLVSNRIATIRKCMESLKQILDVVPGELIAVDTVGEENSDGSLAVVREYTDQIVHVDWTGDFSAARNAGLKRAKGEWFLYVDDDEWFDDPSELIEFFQHGDYLKYGCTQYAVRSYTDRSMTDYSEGWVSRMVRRTPEIRFIHPVHEMLTPICYPEKKFSKLFAHHVGYIFKNQEEKDRHFERNIHPILEELEREPDNLRLMMQAVQEYLFHKDYEKAEEYCRLGEQNHDPKYELVWNWIMSSLVQTLVLQEKPEKALQEGLRILESPRVNELARMNIDYLMIGAAETMQDQETLLEYAEDYIRLQQYFDENEQRVLEQVMLSLSDILLDRKRQYVHHVFFFACKTLQRYEQLCEYADSIAWDKDYMKQKVYVLFLIEAAMNAERYDCLTRTMDKICRQGALPEDWIQAIRKVSDRMEKETKSHFYKALSQVDCEAPYFHFLRAWCAEHYGGNVQAALQKCLDYGLDCASPREELLGICLRAGIDPTPFLEPLYMEDWVVSFSQLVKCTPKEELRFLLDCAQKTLQPVREIQYIMLAKMIREKLLTDPDFPDDLLWETARDYVGDMLGYSRRIYQNEMFLYGKQYLPREVIFALKLEEGLQAREHGKLDDTFSALKECVKAYPPRKDIVNRLLGHIQQEIQMQKEHQQEFTELGQQIKKQLYQLIALGQMAQAQQILETLRTLVPDDQELDVIAQQILV